MKLHYEDIPADAASSFVLREFRWPRFPFNWHYHPELELTWIVKGAGLRFVGDSVEEFAPGDLCFIGSNTPHCWASHPGAARGAYSVVIQFRPELLGGTFLQTPEMRPVMKLMRDARRGLKIREPESRAIRQRMEEITRQRPHSLQRLCSLLAILAHLADTKCYDSLTSIQYEQPSNEAVDKKLARVLNFVYANFGPELTQRDVAKSIGYSPQAFSRFFKQAMGKPYVHFVNELKIHKACRALIETTASVTEVAFNAGFNNLSHFNAQFRRVKKTTPLNYRKVAHNLTL
jgi:AraC-like DNA-binding protein